MIWTRKNSMETNQVSNEQTEKESRKPISFTIGINSMEKMKDQYNGNYKSLKKEDIRRQKDI
jgi:hypothetical protein